MNRLSFITACLLLSLGRAETIVETTVTQVPAEATEVLFILDVVAATEGPGYEDPNVAPPVTIPAAAAATPADPAAPAPAAPQRRRRPNAAKPPPAIHGSLKPTGTSPLVWRTVTPAGENFRVRVVALKGTGTFPLVIAGGKATGLKITTDQVTRAAVSLTAPRLQLAEKNPSAVAPGATFTLAGTVQDPASFLGTKNRMRVWWSAGQPPAENRAGRQVSTVDVTTKGDVVSFAVELTAPREPGPLYVQFGEVSPDFNRADGTQVPYLVFPDLAAGLAPVKVIVGDPARRFGAAGSHVEAGLQRASEVRPMIVAAVTPRGWADRESLGAQLADYAKNEGSDTEQFENFAAAARRILAGGTTAKRAPDETSRWFDATADAILASVRAAEANVGPQRGKEFDATMSDLRIHAQLARFHARRTIGAVHYNLFLRGLRLAELYAATLVEREAVAAWRELVKIAEERHAFDRASHWRAELKKLEGGLKELEEQCCPPDEAIVKEKVWTPVAVGSR
jgi:hypothetical protein